MLQFVSWLAAVAWGARRRRLRIEGLPCVAEESWRLWALTFADRALSRAEDYLLERESYAWGGVKWRRPPLPLLERDDRTIAEAIRRLRADVERGWVA